MKALCAWVREQRRNSEWRSRPTRAVVHSDHQALRYFCVQGQKGPLLPPPMQREIPKEIRLDGWPNLPGCLEIDRCSSLRNWKPFASLEEERIRPLCSRQALCLKVCRLDLS